MDTDVFCSLERDQRTSVSVSWIEERDMTETENRLAAGQAVFTQRGDKRWLAAMAESDSVAVISPVVHRLCTEEHGVQKCEYHKELWRGCQGLLFADCFS